MNDGAMKSADSMANFRATFGVLPNKSLRADYYAWKLQLGSWLEGFIHLEQRDGRDAGSATVTGKPILVRGQEVLAFEIGDTYTHPDHRRKGVFLNAVNACVAYATDRGAKFIYGTPNDASLPGYVAKAEFIQIEGLRIAILTRRITRRSLAKALQRRVRFKLLAEIGAALIYRVRVVARAIRMIGQVPAREAQFEQFPMVDGAWGGRDEFLFWTRRDSSFINWRYKKNPDSYRLWMVQQGDATMGYAVAKFYTKGDSYVCAICDFASINDDTKVTESLIANIEMAANKEGVDYCEMWCSSRSPCFNVILRMGYKEIDAFPVIINAGSPMASVLKGAGKWHFTLSDSDNI